MKSPRPKWYPLDHSAKIWPALLSPRYTSFFRLSAVLDHPLVVESLFLALERISRRYPYFSATLHSGLFWYFLEESGTDSRSIRSDDVWPCMNYPRLSKERRLMGLYVFGQRVSLEVSHILSDGMGAKTFFQALLGEYLSIEKDLPARLGGGEVLPGDSASPQTELRESLQANSEAAVSAELRAREWVDSYLEHGLKGAPGKQIPEAAYHLPDRLLPRGEYRVVSAHTSLSSVKTAAKQRGVSVSEYLVALLFASYQQIWLEDAGKHQKSKNPIRILVPVDLRSSFHSQTLRNFFVYVDPQIDPRLGEYQFDEILVYVHHYMRGERHRQNLKRHFARLARTEQTWAVRMIPLALKNLVLSMSYAHQGDKRFTTSFSNIGSFELPEACRQHVSWVDFIPPPSPVLKQALSAISYNDTLSLSFGKMIEDGNVERRFCRMLADFGHPVVVHANFHRRPV